MARPTKLTYEIVNIITTLIEGGVPREHAARAAGIHPSTLYVWLARGDAESGDPIDPRRHTRADLLTIAARRDITLPASWTKQQIAEHLNDNPSMFQEFSDRVRAADSRFMAQAIGMMREVGGSDWRMWDRLIERRFPELRVTHSTDDEGSGQSLDQDAAQKALDRADQIKVKMLEAG